MNKSRKRLLKRLAIGGVVVILAAVGINQALKMGDEELTLEDRFVFDEVKSRDLKVTLSGTGTLKPANAYTVVSLISGDIVSAPFEEGNVVSKDDLLYMIDSESVSSNIETASLSLSDSARMYERTLKSLDDLELKSDYSGTIISLPVSIGDDIKAGQTIAIIRDQKQMTIEIPFINSDARQLKIGDAAQISLVDAPELLKGTVTEIAAFDEVASSGALIRKVTLSVVNPGALLPGMTGIATIHGINGQSSGTFSYAEEGTILAMTTGEVEAILVKEGDLVKKGQTLVKLKNDALMDEIESARNSVRRAEISLESQNDTLENYMIKSPISGTVIEKNYKEGDTLESGKVVTTLFDLSYLTFTLQIDELDISKIQVGQSVEIKAGALPDQLYSGTVTKININGITNGGTTSYPVTIRIDATEGLLPGMNVDAEIIIEQKTGVLSVPNEAIQRGNRILVKSTTAETTETEDATIPSGYVYVTVTTGSSDNDYTEILTGLTSADLIAYPKRIATNTLAFPQGRPGDADTSYEEVETP